VEVVCGFVVPIVSCFIFLILMRYFVTPLSYLILVLVNVTSVLFTVFAFIKAGWIGNNALNALTGQSGNSTSISFVGSDGLVRGKP
jgi:choline transporter-like protein 2/4/5